MVQNYYLLVDYAMMIFSIKNQSRNTQLGIRVCKLHSATSSKSNLTRLYNIIITLCSCVLRPCFAYIPISVFVFKDYSETTVAGVRVYVGRAVHKYDDAYTPSFINGEAALSA